MFCVLTLTVVYLVSYYTYIHGAELSIPVLISNVAI